MILKKENLKKNAALNSATSVLDQGVKIVIGFIINPFIISGLGSYIFGVWQVLNQFTNYTTLTNIRISEVLKWKVARDRRIVPKEELQESLTSALFLIVLIIPLFLTLGGILTYYAPQITRVDLEYHYLVRATASILVMTIIIKSIFSLFESVLRGMNIGYKSMGIRASIIILGGGLKITALKFGYGLIGLAFVQTITVLLTGIVILIIVKKNVPWFGYGAFNKKKTKDFVKTSSWFMAWMGVKTLLVSSDKVFLGYLLGPIIVTKYVVTNYIGKATQGIITNILHGVLPGVGSLFGQGKHQKLINVRSDMILITWILSGVMGLVIILFNSSFASLWVGSNNYLTQQANLAILLMMTQYLFIQNDSVLINTMLDVKSKTILGFFSVILSLFLAYFFSKNHGATGFIFGVVLGRLLLSISYPKIVKNKTLNTTKKGKNYKLIIVIIMFWFLAFYAEKLVVINNWFVLLFCMFFASILALFVLVFLGIKKSDRKRFFGYIKEIRLLKN